MKRKFLLLVVLGLVAGAVCAQPQAKDKHDVYLLIGQSNMAGRAKVDGQAQKPLLRTFLMNADGDWEPAIHPLNRYSTIRKGLGMQQVGPGGDFAEVIARKFPGRTIGLVVNAKGGSRIDQWEKGGKFFEQAVRRAKEVKKSGTLRGILWHQGESDAEKPDGYLEKLAELVANLRAELDAPNLPFVAGQVNDVPRINEQIAELPSKVKNTGFISSEGLKTTDRWHFDAASVRLMGERYADEMIRLLQP